MEGRQGERTDIVATINDVTHRPDGTSTAQALWRLRTSRPELPARVVTWELLAADAWAYLAWALAELRRDGALEPDTRR
jgi:hypothetical protein